MNMNPIPPLAPMEPMPSVESSGKAAKSTGSFAGVLSEAIGNAAELDQVDHAGMAALLSGQDVEPYVSMIESTEAELALNLAIQIRNKVVDAYNEVMRMQV